MVAIFRPILIPQSNEGFDNPFQTDGPKGYIERRRIGNRLLYVRIDLPGVGHDDVRVTFDDSKRGVIIKAEASDLNINDSSQLPRIYKTYIQLYCDCCEVSSFERPQVFDGVLRLLISTTPRNIDGVPCSAHDPRHSGLHLYDTNPNDPVNTGQTERPRLIQGPDTAFEYKQLPDGGAYVRLDMPGVPDNDFSTSVEVWRVKVTGKAPALWFDSSGRSYSADAALLFGTFPTLRLEKIIKNGVMRLFIHPV